MKLTWFGGSAFRVHIGGVMLVVDPDTAWPIIERAELLSGADRILGSHDTDLPQLDVARWRPRRPDRLSDASEVSAQAVDAFRIAPGALLIEAVGEPPLVLISAASTVRFARWADGAVATLVGEGQQLIEASSALLELSRPRLVALAGEEAALETAVGTLRERLDGTPLMALEPGLALEV